MFSASNAELHGSNCDGGGVGVETSLVAKQAVLWQIQGRGQGGLAPPPPPPHTHTHTHRTQKNSLDFVLLTLLALDVQTLR